MEKLKKLRIDNNYTYQQIADILNISKTYYWQIENNKRRLNYELAIKISKVFKLKPDDVFYNDFTKNKKN